MVIPSKSKAGNNQEGVGAILFTPFYRVKTKQAGGRHLAAICAAFVEGVLTPFFERREKRESRGLCPLAK